MATSRWRFSDEEIRSKLEELGYTNIPEEALTEFSNDLHRLILKENGREGYPSDHSSSSVSMFNRPVTTTVSELTISHESDQVKPSRPFTKNSSGQYVAAEKENQGDSRHETSLRLAQKRKVLRRKNGQARVFDESFTNNACASDISDVERRLQELPLKEESDSGSISDDQSEKSFGWPHWAKNRNILPSFIRPRSSGPESCGVRKTDPVNRYHQFRREWSSNKVPGEKTHKNLRWATREQMLQYEVFEKPRHTYIPNNYVAPTAKKRQALRWEVRSTLANS